MLQIFFKSQISDRFKERTYIAKALGLISLVFIPQITDEVKLSFEVNLQSVYYFAQRLLKYCAGSDYGSVLRCQYTLCENDIDTEISKLNNDYDEQALNDSQKVEIDSVFDTIGFTNSSQTSIEGILSNDIRLITKYIQDKEPNRPDGTQKELEIKINFADGVSRVAGKLFCHEDGCDIHCPTIENIHAIRRLEKLEQINELAAIRLIVAHELGHIVCHRIPGYIGPIGEPTKSSPDDEKEATYFARLLLEHRELLYNNMVEDNKYHNACKEIKKLIEHVYHSRDKEWLDWVLS